jgi:protein-L-isoaspartate O-methyltransferase
MDKEKRFLAIKEYFAALDAKKEKKEEKLVFETEKGIFGTSNVQDIYDWLTSLELSEDIVFLDLGSGDGRVAIVADLFCTTKGIEYDAELVEASKKHAKALESTAELVQGDYTDIDYNDAQIVFCYADHEFSKELVTKLKEQFSGTLYVYQGTFFPNNATKGKTTWIGQTPILTYTFVKEKPKEF